MALDEFNDDNPLGEEFDPEQMKMVPVRPRAALAANTPGGALANSGGIGLRRFTTEQQAVIERAIDPNDVDVLPTGEIYYSQVQYRKRLNEAFGPGGWGLVPLGPYTTDGQGDDATLCREYGLAVEGRFVAFAIGEADFQPDNPRFSKATAAEVVKSIAVRRCCKDLGIADECWDKRFVRDWLSKYAVRVWTVGVAVGNKGKKKPLWRRKDGDPFDYPWREDGRASQGNVDETETPVVTLDPNQKWKDWCAKALATDRKRFFDILGNYGFSTGEEVKDRKSQIEIYKEWEGEENG